MRSANIDLDESKNSLWCVCDENGLPLHFHLTTGQTHESTVFDILLEGADQFVIDDDGNPVAWTIALAGDKGYRADWIDDYLLELGIKPVIPSKVNDEKGSRPVKFNREATEIETLLSD